MGRRWYLFGPFRFDGELLYQDTTPIPLWQRHARVLQALIENRGHLVTKETLRSACGVRAVDNTVNRAVCELRKALGIAEAAATITGTSVWIRTVEGQGYVLEDSQRKVTVLEEPSIEAEHDYYEGLERWNRREPEAVLRARDCVNRALKREPRYARAYSFLADTYAVLGAYWWIAPHDAADKALMAAQRALDFDRQLAAPHATVGFVRALFQRRWTEAEHAFLRCLEHAPDYGVGHHWFALHLAATGQLSAAAREVELARSSDRSRSVDVHCASIQYWSRNQRRAEQLALLAIEEHPDFWYARYQLALVLEEQGRLPEALKRHGEAVACDAGPTGLTLAALARATALAGEREEAERLLAQACLAPHPMLASFHIAAAYVALGDHDRAFAVLEGACAAKDLWMSYVAVDPRMDALRSDGRFARVLERLNLSRAAA